MKTNALHPMIRQPLHALCLLLLCCTMVQAEDIRIFDGSSRAILYQTSSHGGQRELQELLRLVPGGEGMTVEKMPYSWRKNDEGVAKIRSYPVIIARLGNHFDPPFKIKSAPVGEEKLAAAVAELDASIQERLQRDQPQRWVGINGHWHQMNGTEEGEALLASAEVFRRWQAANTNPHAVVLDTMTACHAHYPLTVRSDHFHAGGVAGYVEGLAIVRQLCAFDGIELPKAVEEYVAQNIAEAADKRDAFTITVPTEGQLDADVALGAELTCSWTVDDPAVKAVYVTLHRLGRDDYYLSDRLEVGSPGFGSLTWTVQNNLPSLGNRLENIAKGSPATAKREPFKEKIPGGSKRFCFRIVDADNPDTYTFSPHFNINF